MFRYSFYKLFVFSCASVLLMLAGCDQQSALEEGSKGKPMAGEQASPETPTEREKRINAALDAMARDVAAALNHASVRTLVKKETGKLLAGQHNVLYETIASKKVRGMAKNNQPITFRQVLVQQRAGSPKSREAMRKAGSGVRTDSESIPKFDIGVPVQHGEWNAEETTPLVAFHHRREIDDTDLGRVKAYDAEGTVHWLDAEEAPDRSVVVVGINERTTAEGRVQSVYRKETAAMRTNNIKEGEGGDGGSGGGGSSGGGSNEDSFEYGETIYLDRVKVNKDHEVWVHQDPEIYMIVKSGDDSKMHTSDMERDGGNMFGDDTSWNEYNKHLFKWDRYIGPYVGVGWHERDNGGADSYSAKWNGDKLNFSFKYTNSSDKMGFQAVQIGVDEGTTFKLGDVNFEYISKR